MAKTINIDDVDWTPFIDYVKENPPMYRGRRMPYVLFGFIAKSMKGGTATPEPSTHCLSMAGCHASENAISFYHKKGYKVLHYWFPITQSDIDKFRFEGTATTFQVLAEHCEYLKANDPSAVRRLAVKNEMLEKKLAEAEARLAKQK